MGGPGSGRWGWHDKAQTVDDGLTLDLGKLLRDGLLMSNRWGTLTWTSTRTGEYRAAVGYRVEPAGDDLTLTLDYRTTIRGTAYDVTEPIVLHATRQRNGGRRWWFTCPACGRRCAKLHSPPGRRYFWCRLCHGLTYTSCQESHKYDGLFRGMGWDPAIGRRLERHWKAEARDEARGTTRRRRR